MLNVTQNALFQHISRLVGQRDLKFACVVTYIFSVSSIIFREIGR